MKKGLSLFSLFLTFSLLLTGCGGGQAAPQSPSSANRGSGGESASQTSPLSNNASDSQTAPIPESEASTPQPEISPADAISLTTKIVELEPGLSAVRYDGDYGFDGFLEQGGASSDREVVQYLAENLIGELGLDFLGNIFGCSTVTANSPDGGVLFGRNFDWNACEAMVVEAHPENGYASLSTVNMDFITMGAAGMMDAALKLDQVRTLAALYAPLDGMNEKGLVVSVNMIQDNASISQNTGKPGITTTTAVRLLLDKAAAVEEALELLRQYDFHASMGLVVHLALADSTGRSVVVEYVGNEMSIVETPVVTNFTTVTDSAGRSVSFEYEKNDLTRFTNADGDTLLYTYDGKHNLLTVEDFNGNVYLTNEYDSKHRVTNQYIPDRGQMTFTYDDANRTNRYEDENGLFCEITMDDNNCVLSQTTPDGTETYEYDSLLRMTKKVDCKGGVWQYTYWGDSLELPASITYPDGHKETFEYNDEQMTKKVQRDGQVFTYTYDEDRLTSETDANGGTRTYTYDDRGYLKSSKNDLGKVTNYTCDDKGNVLTETDPLGHTREYAYSGNRKTIYHFHSLCNPQ